MDHDGATAPAPDSALGLPSDGLPRGMDLGVGSRRPSETGLSVASSVRHSEELQRQLDEATRLLATTQVWLKGCIQLYCFWHCTSHASSVAANASDMAASVSLSRMTCVMRARALQAQLATATADLATLQVQLEGLSRSYVDAEAQQQGQAGPTASELESSAQQVAAMEAQLQEAVALLEASQVRDAAVLSSRHWLAVSVRLKAVMIMLQQHR